MASLSPARAEVEAGVVAKVEQQYLLRLVPPICSYSSWFKYVISYQILKNSYTYS